MPQRRATWKRETKRKKCEIWKPLRYSQIKDWTWFLFKLTGKTSSLPLLAQWAWTPCPGLSRQWSDHSLGHREEWPETAKAVRSLCVGKGDHHGTLWAPALLCLYSHGQNAKKGQSEHVVNRNRNGQEIQIFFTSFSKSKYKTQKQSPFIVTYRLAFLERHRYHHSTGVAPCRKQSLKQERERKEMMRKFLVAI